MIFLAVFPVTPQEFTPDTEIPEGTEFFPPDTVPETPAVNEEEMLFVITDFYFEIRGRTREDALIRNIELKRGEKINGKADLEKYIRDKKQMIINQRVLKDNAEISYTIGDQQKDGSYPVIININVEDSWNIIALPRPKYKNDTGFDLTIKARDYNLLGTMNPLRVDLGYIYQNEKQSYNGKQQHTFKLEVYSDTPFNAFGYTWNFRFDNLFWYRSDAEQPFFYRNVTGLSMELPFRTTTFTFGFEEFITVNEENSDGRKQYYKAKALETGEPYIGDFQAGPYMTSRPYISWKIPTGLTVSRYGELSYIPSLSAIFNHELSDKWPLLEFRNGPFINFDHSLGFERIDWHSNYRDGLSLSIGNSYSYDFYRLRNEQEPLSISFSAIATGHFIISDFFGISSRLLYRYWFYHDPNYSENAADVVRGIADKSINADYMLSLNMDFPFRVFLFTPSKWFNNRKMRFFDLEFHASPVIDMALYHDPQKNISFNPKNIVTSGGGEVIIFSAFMRTLYARVCVAWNLRELFDTGKLPGGDNREISFTIGHFY